ncbi:efflux RND transporter periplasmic adaptor subunit [Lacimicrobium alkaliphilum]|uniref:Hemolysin D n=1 Tax=Lacimicrobium alkaliphilum TaxID=1526571 RepID=A0A0U2QR51_9ALTE|nr:efflux RND transporter periplasmic adaptor subunit [Lacimicrobium alkaliphilum]ALT00316.1 hemolysin D [Lacimicrobium alkaliphilum]
MAKKFTISPVLILLLMVSAVTVYLYLQPEEAEPSRQMSAVPVTVAEATQQDFAVVVEALGTATANEAVQITAQQSEVIARIGFDDGDMVEKGQLLVQLNDREEKARVSELEINLQEAKRQLQRITNLARENATSAQLLDEQEARVNALKAQLEVSKSQLAELEIRAPFAGKLGIRRVSNGALVRPGDLITTLDDLSKVKVDFSIAERHLSDVAKGLPISATTVAYPGVVFRGQIISMDSRLDPVTRSVQVRALVDNPELRLRPGMLLQILLQKQVLNTLVLPESALIPIQDQQFVYVVGDDSKVQKREVKIGRRKPGLVQVVSGLDAGDRVVVEGALKLGDGMLVNVLEP